MKKLLQRVKDSSRKPAVQDNLRTAKNGLETALKLTSAAVASFPLAAAVISTLIELLSELEVGAHLLNRRCTY